MTCSLGDIIFELLIGLGKYEDTREMTYAQVPLIGRKSTLQQTGEKPQEISITIGFRDAFCIPEEQYAALDKKRVSGEILTFIWGTGEIEGDYVITSHKKTINELGPGGEWRDVSCDLTLLESYNSNKVPAARQKIERAAFATNLDTPRPANIQVTEPSPATDVMDDVQDVNINTDQVSTGLGNAVNQANSKNVLIDKAQEFVDRSNEQSYQLSKLTRQTSQLLSSIGVKMAASTNMQVIAPLLTAQVAASTTIVNDADTLISGYSAMPNPVNNLTDANTVLNVLNDTVQAVQDLTQTIAQLKTASQPLAVAIATRKDV
jgi:phage protein U